MPWIAWTMTDGGATRAQQKDAAGEVNDFNAVYAESSSTVWVAADTAIWWMLLSGAVF